MACFIAPLVVGIVLAIARKLWRGAERARLDILAYMMLGGALVLMAEHAWHGEVVPWPPFLTAMKSPEDLPVLVGEVTRVGGSMVLAATGAWLLLLGVSRRLQAKAAQLRRLTTTLEHAGARAGV